MHAAGQIKTSSSPPNQCHAPDSPPIQAPLIISNGSRPAFGRITPNPSISVRQTQAPAMGNMFPKMGKE